MMTEHEMWQLSGVILERLFEDILLGKPLGRELSFTIMPKEDIPATCIRRHYYPDGIPDPYNCRTNYYWTQGSDPPK
jgi:hypothetical protein